MVFLNAALLAGVAAIAVPILLHMILRRQPKRLEFPALRLVRRREQANKRRLRLRQLLLLAMRCGVIVLLAAALARPSLIGAGMSGDQDSPVAAALVFDTSARMNYRHANQTRLEAAREIATWLMSQFPPESDVAVVDSQTASPVFAVDPGAARQRIGRLDTAAVARPLDAMISDSLRLVGRSDKQRKELYVFTDLARASWPESSAAGLRAALAEAPTAGVYLVDVGVQSPRNFSLGSLRQSGQVLSRNSRLHVETEVSALGADGELTVELRLAGRTKDVVSRQAAVTLADGAARKVAFALGSLAAGVHQGSVRITSTDGLADDDVRYFSVEIRPAWRVLLAAPAPAATSALFLAEALAPHALRVQGSAAFECDVAELAELSRRDLAGYSAVCLLDPTPLPVDVWQKLAGFAANGNGVGIFLGRRAEAAAMNAPAAQQLLPAPLVRQWRESAGELHLAPDNFQHPILARFRDLETTVPWDNLPVFRHWELGPLASGASAIVNFSNNLPAIVERPLGKGRVITMTTSVSDPANRKDTWNLLPTGDEPWPFVMLANELAYYLVGRGEARLNYEAGEVAMLRIASEQSPPMFLLHTPRGDQLRHTADLKQQSVSVRSTDVVGNYRLTAGGAEGIVDIGFSVNLSPQVTQLERATTDQIKKLFGDAPFRLARGREEIDRTVSVGRAGRELYPILILIVALLLVGEIFLSNRFYRREFSEVRQREAEAESRLQIERTRHSQPDTEVAAR